MTLADPDTLKYCVCLVRESHAEVSTTLDTGGMDKVIAFIHTKTLFLLCFIFDVLIGRKP